MKASIYTQYGPPSVLQIKDVEKPTPKDNEVLIKVMATTVNRTDCAMLRAPFPMPLFIGLFKPNKTTLGTDFAGTIEAVGKDVKNFKVGDRVFGFDDMGLRSHAEYLTLSEKKAFALMPTNSNYIESAAALEGAHYAINMLNKVMVKVGQKILVNGATGAIGSALVQFLVAMGVEVVAVCATENIATIKSLGVNRVIDYKKEDFTKESVQYDFVFDAVGKSAFGKCKPILKPGGVYISSELGAMAQNVFFALMKPIIGSKKVVFPIPFDIKTSIIYVTKLMEEGKFKPLIDRKFSLEEIAEAFQYVETGQKVGNVVVEL